MLPTKPSSISIGLQRVARAKREMDVLCGYQGLPVVIKASLSKVGPESAIIHFDQPEAVCLSVVKTVTLLSDLLDEAVTARVAHVSLADGNATLDQLRYATRRLSDRMTARVAPHDPITVKLDCGGQTLWAELVDVSMNGLGLRVPLDAASPLRPRAVVQVELPLPATTLKLSGTVQFMRTLGEARRVGLLFAQAVEVNTLLHYVRDRQAQIMQELQDLYKTVHPSSAGG